MSMFRCLVWLEIFCSNEQGNYTVMMPSSEVPSSSPLRIGKEIEDQILTKSGCLPRFKLSHRDLNSLSDVCLLFTYSSFIDWFLDCLFSLALHQCNCGFE